MPDFFATGLCLALFVAMLVALELGFRYGRRLRKAERGADLGIIDSAIFALLGLLLGFAFAGAMSRLGERRALIAEEVNAIQTAYLRLDMLSPADEAALRPIFHRYLEARLQVYESLERRRDPRPAIRNAMALQHQIWAGAVEAHEGNRAVTELLLPAVNEMIAITARRSVALISHTPALIMSLLVAVALLSALLAGHAMSKQGYRSWLHAVLFAATISLTIYTVYDLDNPQRGFIRLDGAERVLQDLRSDVR